MKISELKTGQEIVMKLVLAEVGVRQTSTKPPRDYLTATFSDGSGNISGNWWNYVNNNSLPEKGKVYLVTAAVDEYRDKKQLNIKLMTLSDDQDMSAFRLTYNTDLYSLSCALEELLEDIENAKLNNVTTFIYESYMTKIKGSTSAKAVHHVGAGGNLAHTIEVARYSKALSLINNDVDTSLCIAGALLHDIGKIHAMQIVGPVVEYTQLGNMLDHIVLGISIVDEAEKRFGPDYSDVCCLLKHIIASHHQELEYGSPVTPRFAEAYIVAAADRISATLGTLSDANNKAVLEGRDMTEKLYTLGNREHFLQRDIARRLFDD